MPNVILRAILFSSFLSQTFWPKKLSNPVFTPKTTYMPPFLSVLLAINHYSHGTAIVIIRTPDSIFVAADSKILMPVSPFSTTECKIRFVDETGFALAGIFSESISGFDLIQITAEVCSKSGTLQDKFQYLEESLREPVISAMNNIYHALSNPRTTELGVQVAIFGFQQDTPFVFRLTLSPIFTGSNITGLHSQKTIVPDINDSEPFALIFLAQSQEILDVLQRNPLSAPSWAEAADKMIQLAIEKQPNSIGLPIDVVSITREGRKWIQKKKECPG
jgi:20S proteasome alpha/beta subunit